MKNHLVLCAALLSIAPIAVAQEFPTAPQPETMQQAIQYQKKKDTADASQARKEAGETAKVKASKTRAARKSARRVGQADRSKSQ